MIAATATAAPEEREQHGEGRALAPRRRQRARIADPNSPPTPAEAAPRAVIVLSPHRQQLDGQRCCTERCGVCEMTTAQLHCRGRKVGERLVVTEVPSQTGDARRGSHAGFGRQLGERATETADDRAADDGDADGECTRDDGERDVAIADVSTDPKGDGEQRDDRGDAQAEGAEPAFRPPVVGEPGALRLRDHIARQLTVPSLRLVLRSGGECVRWDDAADRLRANRVEDVRFRWRERVASAVVQATDRLAGLDLLEVDHPARCEVQEDGRGRLGRHDEIAAEQTGHRWSLWWHVHAGWVRPHVRSVPVCREAARAAIQTTATMAAATSSGSETDRLSEASVASTIGASWAGAGRSVNRSPGQPCEGRSQARRIRPIVSAVMEVRIGVLHSPKELELEVDSTPDDVAKTFDDALKQDDGVLWLTDTKGRRVGVSAQQVAYVEIQTDHGSNKVGFGRPS